MFTSLQLHHHRHLCQHQQQVCLRLCQLRQCAFISRHRSAISGFVVQAAVPKTAKVSHFVVVFFSFLSQRALRCAMPAQTAHHRLLCHLLLELRCLQAAATSLLRWPPVARPLKMHSVIAAQPPLPLLICLQVMRVSNTIVDQKPLAMRLKILYTAAAGPVTKTHDVTNFPPGV